MRRLVLAVTLLALPGAASAAGTAVNLLVRRSKVRRRWG